MENLEVKLKVAKESFELADGIAEFAIVVAKEIKDNGGYSSIDDLPGIGVAIVALLPAFSGAANIGEELKNDSSAFIASWTVAGLKVLEALKG
jgi:hypothetical protein